MSHIAPPRAHSSAAPPPATPPPVWRPDPPPPPAAAAPSRRRAAVELAFAVAFAEVFLWALRPLGGLGIAVSLVALAGLFVASALRRMQTPRAPAPRRAGRARAWLEAALATGAIAALVLALGAVLRETYEPFELYILDKRPGELARWLAAKLFSVFAQQLALQHFLYPLACEVFPRRGAARLATAAVFGLLHLPRPVLVGLSALGAYAWVRLYERCGRLLPVAASHLFLAILAHAAIPERLHDDMRVGARALENAARADVYDIPAVRAKLREVTAPAYIERNGLSDRMYILALYRDLLDRVPSEAEIAVWERFLKRKSKIRLVRKIATSEEFRARYGA